MSTPHERLGVSRSSVDRAGEHLRDWSVTGLLVGPPEQEAFTLVDRYRSEFKRPLRSVVMGLRSAVRTAGAEVVVTERLKRQPRIIGKLVRFSRMDLTRMQDIAGCRAILDDLDAVAAIHQRVARQKSEVVKVNDYNATPAHSGYRALHLVVRRDGALVEVQLRTAGQQAWGTLVEDLDAAYGLQLKDETGPDEVLGFLRVYAPALAERDQTGSVARDTARDVSNAREAASDWLLRRRM